MSDYLGTRQNHASDNRMLPHHRNQSLGTGNSAAVTKVAPHQQNSAKYNTNDDHGKQPPNPHMDKPSTHQWKTTTHVKPGKSSQELSQIHTTKYRTYRHSCSTSIVEAKSYDRDLTTHQERSSAGSQTTTKPNPNTRPNNIHRWLRPWWTHRRSNVLTLTQSCQKRIHWHRRHP